jgi:hypothetical protein
MRLLERKNDGEFTLTKDIIDNIPHYAILSHTWGADTEEVTFRDLTESGFGRNDNTFSALFSKAVYSLQYAGPRRTAHGQ